MAPVGNLPVSTYLHSAITSLRARAMIMMLRTRPFSPATRLLCQSDRSWCQSAGTISIEEINVLSYLRVQPAPELRRRVLLLARVLISDNPKGEHNESAQPYQCFCGDSVSCWPETLSHNPRRTLSELGCLFPWRHLVPIQKATLPLMRTAASRYNSCALTLRKFRRTNVTWEPRRKTKQSCTEASLTMARIQ
jgi:hypothetical protein